MMENQNLHKYEINIDIKVTNILRKKNLTYNLFLLKLFIKIMGNNIMIV